MMSNPNKYILGTTYVCCPYVVNQKSLDKVLRQLRESRDPNRKHLDSILYHKKGDRYQPNKLENADRVVFLLPELAFSCDYHKLTQGIRKELVQAHKLNKPMYIGYIRRGEEDFTFYKILIESLIKLNLVKGIAGPDSFNAIYNDVFVTQDKDYKKEIQIISEEVAKEQMFMQSSHDSGSQSQVSKDSNLIIASGRVFDIRLLLAI